MVVDASALVAILLDEPEKPAFAKQILANDCVISPVGYWEAAIRARHLHGEAGVNRLERLIARLDIKVMPAAAATARLASEAERDFGKRTPARLNLGDCFAYALAHELGATLLFKGEDFTHTDIKPAIPT